MRCERNTELGMTPRSCPEKQGEHLIRWRRLENKWVWSGRNREGVERSGLDVFIFCLGTKRT